VSKYSSSSQGVDAWKAHLESFGLGQYMGYDLPSGQKGRIPGSDLYNNLYKGWNWKGSTIVSNAIGQGEVEMTPIQLANVMCAVANEGYYFTPHIIKKIENKQIDKTFIQKKQTTIDKQHFRPVIEGLHEVYKSGTARRLQIADINICGKTGTVENFATVDGEKTKLQDHSVFLAFAPKENPKIVIAVFIENGGFGATWAGPIASLMIEKYLKGEITRTDLEKRMLEGDLSSNYVLKDIAEKQKEERDRLKRVEKERLEKLKANRNGKN